MAGWSQRSSSITLEIGSIAEIFLIMSVLSELAEFLMDSLENRVFGDVRCCQHDARHTVGCVGDQLGRYVGVITDEGRATDVGGAVKTLTILSDRQPGHAD